MSESVTEERDKYIWRMCCCSVVAIVISVACVVVGCLSIVESAPKYLFPYCLGGSAIAGVFVMALASCHVKLYYNFVSNDRDHEDESTIKQWALRQILLISLTAISLMVGLGISGIWGMVKATDVINFESEFGQTSTHDVSYAKDNLVYAVCSFVLVLLLSIVQTCLWCTCLCYTDTYGISNNSSSYRYNQRYNERSRAYQSSPPDRTADEYHPDIRAFVHPGQYNRNHVTTYSNEDLRVNIPRSSDSQRPVPSASSVSRDFRGDRPSTSRHLPETSDVPPRADDTSSDRPPQYEQLFEEPPPSYSQVMTEGAFKVSYV